MVVMAECYGKKEPRFVGATLSWYERNGYEDSDWYAIVWNEEKQCVEEIEYQTTRGPGCGHVEIDATEEVVRKVYNYYRRIGRAVFDSQTNPAQAKKVRKDDMVKVVRGRKIPKGTVGKVFWIGSVFNYYSHSNEERVGIEVDGEKKFLPLEYVEVIDWESRLIHGKERKQRIHNFAKNSMPAHYHRFFGKDEWRWEIFVGHEPSWKVFAS